MSIPFRASSPASPLGDDPAAPLLALHDSPDRLVPPSDDGRGVPLWRQELLADIAAGDWEVDE